MPNRGTIELNGRQFRLIDGDINLAGPVDSTKLDVNASYQVPTQGGGDDEGVLISVHARGRLDSLGLEFTSDPSMSQDDILSYIVTGRPTSDNPLFEGQGTGGGNAGKEIAVGALASAISNTAGQGLGFDVFQIRQEPTRGLTLTAGRYLGSRLFLDLQLPLGSQSQQSDGDESRAGIRAGVHAAALAAGQPPGRQPVAGASVPGAPCVLSAGRGSPLALLAGRAGRSPPRTRSTASARTRRSTRSSSSSRRSTSLDRTCCGRRSR